MTTNTSIPVTVFPSPHHGGLGITRSLGRLGVSVFNVDSSRWCPSFFSRYSSGHFVYDPYAAAPEESLEWLLNIGRRIGTRSLLMATTDASARFVAAHADALAQQFIFPPQHPALVRALLSKKELYALAQQYGVPAPRAFFPRNYREFPQATDQIGFPMIVKPVAGQTWNRAGKSKVLVRTIAEFYELYEMISEAAVQNLIVQEYIPGKETTAWMFNGYFDRESNCRASFTGRKLRQCPIYTGVASLAICEENRTIENTAQTFLRALGYSGIVDIDFRYDGRDGQYKILDVNPRIGSTFRLFVSNGWDVARTCYFDLTGQAVRDSSTHSGRKWIVEDLDLVASFCYHREGLLSVREWLKSLRGIDEYAFLASDDLLPALFMLGADVRELFSPARPHVEPAPAFEATYPAKEPVNL
jgi:D-aspartate ligase